MSGDWDSFCDFLYSSPINTLEVAYYLGETLVGAGILDVEPEAVSTVYCYFDPDLPARSIGTFNILWTIEYCRLRGIPYVYLGYYVANSRQMRYKINFRPCELLSDDDSWGPSPVD
jgi:arginine-tRNA-protein transferase